METPGGVVTIPPKKEKKEKKEKGKKRNKV